MGDTRAFYGPKKRYGNWEVMGSYLQKGISFQDVFDSFEFRDGKTKELLHGPIDRKHKELFTKFLDEIRFPKFIRVVCGGHRGRKPGLGYELDRRLFIILVVKYILPNRELPKDERTVIDNELLKKELELLLNVATPQELLEITFSKRFIKRNHNFNPLTDQRTFTFDKNSGLSFRKRWNIVETDLVFSEEDEFNELGEIIPQSEFGRQHYPTEGYPLFDEFKNDDLTSNGDDESDEGGFFGLKHNLHEEIVLQLMSLNNSATLSRRAAIATHNESVEVAVDWILAHIATSTVPTASPTFNNVYFDRDNISNVFSTSSFISSRRDMH
jgi:hypothetical protein